MVSLWLLGACFFCLFEASAEELATESQEPHIRNVIDDEHKKKKSKLTDNFSLEPPFFRIPHIGLSVIKHREVIAHLHLKVEMEAYENDVAIAARILAPRIADAILTDLFSVLHNRWIRPRTLENNIISDRIKQAADKALGQKAIKTVIIQSFDLMPFEKSLQ